jgi:hypothetical protein
VSMWFDIYLYSVILQDEVKDANYFCDYGRL